MGRVRGGDGPYSAQGAQGAATAAGAEFEAGALIEPDEEAIATFCAPLAGAGDEAAPECAALVGAAAVVAAADAA